MKRILLAAVAAIVLSVGVGGVAQAVPHGGHHSHGYSSHGHGHRSGFRVYTPSFSFGYGGYGGYRGYGCGGYGGYGGGYGYSGHHHHSW